MWQCSAGGMWKLRNQITNVPHGHRREDNVEQTLHSTALIVALWPHDSYSRIQEGFIGTPSYALSSHNYKDEPST